MHVEQGLRRFRPESPLSRNHCRMLAALTREPKRKICSGENSATRRLTISGRISASAMTMNWPFHEAERIEKAILPTRRSKAAAGRRALGDFLSVHHGLGLELDINRASARQIGGRDAQSAVLG